MLDRNLNVLVRALGRVVQFSDEVGLAPLGEHALELVSRVNEVQVTAS